MEENKCPCCGQIIKKVKSNKPKRKPVDLDDRRNNNIWIHGEKFKQVDELQEGFMISNHGRMLSSNGLIQRPKSLKKARRAGYQAWGILKNGKKKFTSIEYYMKRYWSEVEYVNPTKIGWVSYNSRFNHGKTKEECIEIILSNETNEDKHRIKKDNRLVIDYLNGKEEAATILFEAYYKEWTRMANSYIRKFGLKNIRGRKKEFDKEAEDFVQETFFVILDAIKRFRYSGGSFKKWSNKIIINKCAAYFQEERKKMYDLGTSVKLESYDDIWNSL